MKKTGMTMLICFLFLMQTIPAQAFSMYEDDGSLIIYDDTYGQLLLEMGVVRGYANGELGEDNPISRAEMAALLSRICLIEEMEFDSFDPPESPTFKDVPLTHWAYVYIEYLARVQITLGDGQGHFFPDEYLTKGEALLFLSRIWPEYRGYEKTKNNRTAALEEVDSILLDKMDPIKAEDLALRKDVFALVISSFMFEDQTGKSLYEALEMQVHKDYEGFIYEAVHIYGYEETEFELAVTELDEDAYAIPLERLHKALEDASYVDAENLVELFEMHDMIIGGDAIAFTDDPGENPDYRLDLSRGEGIPTRAMVTMGSLKSDIPLEYGTPIDVTAFKGDDGSMFYIVASTTPGGNKEETLRAVYFKTGKGQVGYWARVGAAEIMFNLDLFQP